jgi:hypothetical protein
LNNLSVFDCLAKTKCWVGMSVLITLFSIESKAQTYHLQSDSSTLVDSVVLPDTLLNQSPYVFHVDSLMEKQSANPPKYPWRAAAEVVGINATFLAVDYFILDANFAKVTSKTIKRNPTKKPTCH